MKFNKKAQNVIPILIGVMLIFSIFFIGFMTETEDKITGAVSGMGGVTGYGSLDKVGDFLEKNRLSGGLEFRLNDHGEWGLYLDGIFRGFEVSPTDLRELANKYLFPSEESPVDIPGEQEESVEVETGTYINEKGNTVIYIKEKPGELEWVRSVDEEGNAILSIKKISDEKVGEGLADTYEDSLEWRLAMAKKYQIGGDGGSVGDSGEYYENPKITVYNPDGWLWWKTAPLDPKRLIWYLNREIPMAEAKSNRAKAERYKASLEAIIKMDNQDILSEDELMRVMETAREYYGPVGKKIQLEPVESTDGDTTLAIGYDDPVTSLPPQQAITSQPQDNTQSDVAEDNAAEEPERVYVGKLPEDAIPVQTNEDYIIYKTPNGDVYGFDKKNPDKILFLPSTNSGASAGNLENKASEPPAEPVKMVDKWEYVAPPANKKRSELPEDLDIKITYYEENGKQMAKWIEDGKEYKLGLLNGDLSVKVRVPETSSLQLPQNQQGSTQSLSDEIVSVSYQDTGTTNADYMFSSDQLNLELSYRLQGQDVSNLQNTIDDYSIGEDGTLVGKIGGNKIMMVTMDGYIIYGTESEGSTSWEIQEGVTGKVSSATEDVVLYRLGLDPNSVGASSVEKYYGNIVTVAYDDITQKQINDFRHEMEVKYREDDKRRRIAMVLAEEAFQKGKKPDPQEIISQIEQLDQEKIDQLSGQQLTTKIFREVSGSGKSAPTEFYMSIITGGEEKLDSPRLPVGEEVLTWIDPKTNHQFKMMKDIDGKFVISKSKAKPLEAGEVQYELVDTVTIEDEQAQAVLTELAVLADNSGTLTDNDKVTWYHDPEPDSDEGFWLKEGESLPEGYEDYVREDVSTTNVKDQKENYPDDRVYLSADEIPKRTVKKPPLSNAQQLKINIQQLKNSLSSAKTLQDAIKGWGTDENAIESVFKNINSLEELHMLEIYYKSQTGNDLMNDLKGDLTKKEYANIVDRYLVNWIIADSDKDIRAAYKNLQSAEAEYLNKKNKDPNKETKFKEAQETYREAIKAKLAKTNPLAKARIEVEEARQKLQEAEGKKAIDKAKLELTEQEKILDQRLKEALGDEDYYSSRSDPSNYEDKSTFWEYQECYTPTGECYSKVEAQNARQDALGKQDTNKLAEMYLEGLSEKEKAAELKKLKEGFNKVKDKVTAAEYLAIQIRAKQTLKELTNAGAYKLTSQLLGATLGPWAFEKVSEMCEEEWDASEPVTDAPTNSNPGVGDPTDTTGEAGCPEPFTTLTAQGTKTKAVSKFNYDISWTINPCKENASFDVYLANTETDREMIWSDKAEKGKPKAGRKKFSKDKDYIGVCIKVSDNSVGNGGYVCFPIVGDNSTTTSQDTGASSNPVTYEGEYTGFYDFPEKFFSESSIPKGQIVKVTNAQYLGLKDMHNGITPYASAKIEYEASAYGMTTPYGIKLGDSAFPSLNSGHPRWEVMAHEQGHNFFGGTSTFYNTLAVPGPFLQESFAVLSAFYTYHYIIANQNTLGINSNTITSLNFDFSNGRAYQKSMYDKYVSEGKNFDIQNVLTSQALDFKMIQYGDTYGWQNYKKLSKAFEDGISSQFTLQSDGVSATERSTYIIAALSASFNRDFKQDFKDLNFPIDENLYQEIHPKIISYVG